MSAEIGRVLESHGVPLRAIDGTQNGHTEPEPVTWRTLADVSDEPPGELLLGIAEPAGPTLMYAGPGTGKGTTGAYLAVQAMAAGMKPAIYDAERRPREWARRVAGLGGDRSGIVYIEPSDLPISHRGRPFWDAAPAIGAILAAAGADLLLVDSILPAIGVGEERLRSDASAPFLYVASLDALGHPSISFGHPPKGQPEGEPFGSFAWVAAMRLTWLGTRGDGEGHQIRWRVRKANERGRIAGILLTVEYAADGRPCRVVREDDEASTRAWLLDVLDGEPRSVGDLATELLDQDLERESSPSVDDVDRMKARIRQTLLRMSRDGLVLKDGKGPATKWVKHEPGRLKLTVPFPERPR